MSEKVIVKDKKVPLCEDDRIDLRLRLADFEVQSYDVIAKKKESAATYSAYLKELEEKKKVIVNQLTDNFKLEPTPCLVKLNYDGGLVEYWSKNSGELVCAEPMSGPDAEEENSPLFGV